MPPVFQTNHQLFYWQISSYDSQYAIPSIIPTLRPIYYNETVQPISFNQSRLFNSNDFSNSCMDPVQIGPRFFNSSVYTPYNQIPYPVLLPRIHTPPIEHCIHCSTTYICPHHFKLSPLAPYFCCHYCYTLHTFSSSSSKRKLFYHC